MTPTNKQLGDACEMLVAAELTLAGLPAMKMPDNWPNYDVIAQPRQGSPQRISVKARNWKVGGSNFINYRHDGDFDWLAAVIIMPSNQKEYHREFYLIPRNVFEDRAKRAGTDAKRDDWYCQIDRIHVLFPEYRDNFYLSLAGVFVEQGRSQLE